MKNDGDPYKQESKEFEDFIRVASDVLQESFGVSSSDFWSTYGSNNIDVVIDLKDNR